MCTDNEYCTITYTPAMHTLQFISWLIICLQESDDSFESVGITFLKSIAMATGEYDFDDNLVDRDIFYPFLYYFWIVFVIIMPILFSNLLVSNKLCIK